MQLQSIKGNIAMTTRKHNRNYWQPHQPDQAQPWLHLAMAIIAQAIRDLYDPNPEAALDALAWWIEDSAELVNTVLNADFDEAAIFAQVAKGKGG